MKFDYLKIAIIVLYIIGVGVTAIALFTDYWIIVSVQKLKITVHKGLLRWVCVGSSFISNCFTKFSFFPGWLKFVFLCMCVSLGLQIVLFLTASASLIIKSKKDKLRITVFRGILSFASFVLLSVAIGIFAGKSNIYYFGTIYKHLQITCDLGWSYWLAIIAVVINFLTTVLEGVQIFKIMKNYRINYPYPPEAITTWKFTM